MKILDQSGHIILHKRFNFFVSEQKYAQLQDLQRSGGFASMSALVRACVEKRKVVAQYETYSLDKAMWVFLEISGLLRNMMIDMQEMIRHQIELLDAMKLAEKIVEEIYGDRRELVEKIERQFEDVTATMEPLWDIITKLSEIWLPE